MKNLIILISFALLLSSCSEFAIKERIVGNYFLVAPDDLDELFLGYQDPSGHGPIYDIVTPIVFGVGYNQNFIIAEQYPHKFAEQIKIDTILYYILPIGPDSSLDMSKELIGPLDSTQFAQKKKELHIENLKFSIVYKAVLK